LLRYKDQSSPCQQSHLRAAHSWVDFPLLKPVSTGGLLMLNHQRATRANRCYKYLGSTKSICFATEFGE
jgi:hypothetical protein